MRMSIITLMGFLLIACAIHPPPLQVEPSEVILPGLSGMGKLGQHSEPEGLIGVTPARPMQEFYLLDSIRVVIDDPYGRSIQPDASLKFVIFALPNGNSIEWTMGKQITPDDDWHFNIQHVAAQTAWLRSNTNDKWVLAYLEAPGKSWPAWKRSQQDPGAVISTLFDTLRSMYPDADVYLNSHSGGGSLLNGLIETRDEIPAWVQRISFIDSNYGYTTEIGLKLMNWLDADPGRHLTVFAYNDSIALYNGKPFVSATGGTWYRTKTMLREMSQGQVFERKKLPALITEHRSRQGQVLILLKATTDRGIYHTEQVELNGLIHSVLFGTNDESVGYDYFGIRCYESFIPTTTPEIVRR